MPLVIPNVFANDGLNTRTNLLDANFNTVRDWINARNATAGPIGSRPAAGNAGAIWLATDVNNAIYVDDGAAWQLVGFGLVLNGVESATPTTPAANHAGLYVPIGSNSERWAQIDANGTIGVYPYLLAKAAPANISNDNTEKTLLSYTLKANSLNGTGFGIDLDLVALLLNNSGGTNGITYKVKLGAVTLLTLASGLIAANATSHGIDLMARIRFAAGGGTPPYGASGALRVGNIGIGGTSVGVQVTDFSYGSSAALATISTTVDQTLVVTGTLTAANANLQHLDCVVQATLK